MNDVRNAADRVSPTSHRARNAPFVKLVAEPRPSRTAVARTTRDAYLYGLLGVAVFSVTLPATRIAVVDFDPWLVGLGRAVVAALCAAIFLTARRAPWPRHDWRGLCRVAACVVFGFPLLTSFAMQRLPAAHGAVVVGLLPLSTAVFAMLFTHERPTRGFWFVAVAGSATVALYAVVDGGGSLRADDLLLLGAVLCGGAGYAEGGRLSRTLGGPPVIAWALVLASPIALPAAAWALAHGGVRHGPSLPSLLALGYLSLFSMFVGFFFWYRGLALGGIARVGQLQLLQPFLSVAAAAFLLGEPLRIRTVLFATAVVAWVALGKRASRSPG